MIGGPTAAKKTKLAFEIQTKVPSIIINADSMQVYNELRTLTNVPSKREIEKYACHLFEFVNYPEKCNVGFWFKNVLRILSETKGKIPIFVGGTGLYLESLFGTISPIPEVPLLIKNKIEILHKKYGNSFFYQKLQKVDKDYSKKISSNDTQRLLRAISVKVTTGQNLTYWHKIGSKKIFKKILYITISVNRQELYETINKRCLDILKSNAIMEVLNFKKKKKLIEHPLHKSIGFKVIERFIKGDKNFDESLELFSQETRRYAKRQITWFKNRSKESIKLNFCDAKNFLLKNI